MAELVNPGLPALCPGVHSVEAFIEKTDAHPDATRLWTALEKSLNALIQARAPRVKNVQTVLFSINGKALGAFKNSFNTEKITSGGDEKLLQQNTASVP
jgi:hypothetical protein